MITEKEYFGDKPHTAQQAGAARDLLARRERLRQTYRHATGNFTLDVDPDTGSEISGARGGSGDGGFRLPTSATGSRNSAHKILPPDSPRGAAVDDYDPLDQFDDWLDSFENNGDNSMLKRHGLYREHPSATIGYVHLQTRPTRRRTFYP